MHTTSRALSAVARAVRTGAGFAGRPLISALALWAPVGATIADWNETHTFNPKWPPHAKFHSAQTLLLGYALAGAALRQLWFQRPYGRLELNQATALALAYWLTQAGSLLFPGTALIDPDHDREKRPIPRLYGREVDQLPGLVQGIIVSMIAVSHLLERDRLSRAGRR